MSSIISPISDADEGIRTPTVFPPLDPESSASAGSATSAVYEMCYDMNEKLYYDMNYTPFSLKSTRVQTQKNEINHSEF